MLGQRSRRPWRLWRLSTDCASDARQFVSPLCRITELAIRLALASQRRASQTLVNITQISVINPYRTHRFTRLAVGLACMVMRGGTGSWAVTRKPSRDPAGRQNQAETPYFYARLRSAYSTEGGTGSGLRRPWGLCLATRCAAMRLVTERGIVPLP